MDCAKLHQDIKELKEQYNSLSSMLKSATESGKGKIAISEQLKTATTAEDQILASYLPDFFKKNPELLQLDLGSYIECKGANGEPGSIKSLALLPDGTIMIGGGFGVLYRATIDENGELNLGDRIEYEGKNFFGGPAPINSITPLPDGTIMIGGEYGVLYRATIDENGELNLGNLMECKKTNGNIIYIHSIVPLHDGTIMIGGNFGALYRATINKDGELNLGNLIECKDANGEPTRINSLAPLPDGTIMIGGDNGTLYHATMDENGELNLGNRIECKNINGLPASIYSIAPLPDGTIMIGGDRGTLYRATMDENGELNLGNLIEYKDTDGKPARICSLAPLPDGAIMIGGDNCILYCATIDEDGKLNLGNLIEYEDEDIFGYPASIYSIVPLSDGTIMIGGNSGTLYRATLPQPTLSILKQEIDTIINKG